MKALQIELWDKTNNTRMQTFSNPPLGLLIKADLEGRELRYGIAGNLTVANIAPGDVFELRVSEGVEI